eukprot:scaffold283114_cov30-Tisochrysis_lutea.AAC.2
MPRPLADCDWRIPSPLGTRRGTRRFALICVVPKPRRPSEEKPKHANAHLRDFERSQLICSVAVPQASRCARAARHDVKLTLRMRAVAGDRMLQATCCFTPPIHSVFDPSHELGPAASRVAQLPPQDVGIVCVMREVVLIRLRGCRYDGRGRKSLLVGKSGIFEFGRHAALLAVVQSQLA